MTIQALEQLFALVREVEPDWNPQITSHTMVKEHNGHTICVRAPLFNTGYLVGIQVTRKYHTEAALYRMIRLDGTIQGTGEEKRWQDAYEAVKGEITHAMAWVNSQTNPDDDDHLLGERFWADD